MQSKSFRCKVPDWRDIHKGFWLTLRPGFTALVGPNGAGKTTLLQQIREIALNRQFRVFSYSNLVDGGEVAMQRYLSSGNMSALATAASSSEGELLSLNFGMILSKIKKAVDECKVDHTPLFILLDGMDSGASIDRCKDFMSLIEVIERDAGILCDACEHEVYIVAAVNSYELARRICVNVRTGEQVMFRDYEDYASFVTTFFEKHPALPPKPKVRENGTEKKRTP